jgi:hypothetical protein
LRLLSTSAYGGVAYDDYQQRHYLSNIYNHQREFYVFQSGRSSLFEGVQTLGSIP